MPNELVVEIKPIKSILDLKRTHGIQQQAWGIRDINIIPYTHLIAIQHSGGFVLGAYIKDRLVGFLYSQIGKSDNQIYLLNLGMAVLPTYQNKGIGTKLNLVQREMALTQNIDLILWLYDPFEGKNALISIEKLGGIVNTYVRDIYGSVEEPRQIGLATDQFLLQWHLKHPQTLAILNGEREPALPNVWEKNYRPVNYANWGSGLPRPIATDLDLDDDVLTVQVPSSLDIIRRKDIQIASGWRNTTRIIFETYFDRGYAVTGFASDKGADTPNIYRLERINDTELVDFSSWKNDKED